MNKIKQAINELFEEKVDEGGLDSIMSMIDVKIEESAHARMQEKLDEAISAKEKELEESNAASLGDYKADLTNTISKYLEMATDEFIEENKPSIESEIINEMAASFVTSISTVMKEHNIGIAKSDMDVVADLETRNSKLKKQLTSKINESVEQANQNLEYEKALAFISMTEGFTLSQRERATAIMAGVECPDIDTFKEKLSIVISDFKESHDIDPSDFDEIKINENRRTNPRNKKTKADVMLDSIL